MASPAPLLLTSGKGMSLTHAAALTRAKTGAAAAASLPPPRPVQSHAPRDTHVHCCASVGVHAALQRVFKTCVAHHDPPHDRIQNWRHTIIRRAGGGGEQGDRPGRKYIKIDNILIRVFFFPNFIYSSLPYLFVFHDLPSKVGGRENGASYLKM